jgi:FMN phosphatase YigB (HAD superfamily)
MKDKANFELLVTDIDNTVFDWVSYYTHCFLSLLEAVSKTIKIPLDQLCLESRDVFSQHGSIEYPFLVQELPSVVQYYGTDIDRMLDECVRVARDRYLEVSRDVLNPYQGVFESLTRIRKLRPSMPIVALTDAPRYVAMWKLNKLGLLSIFDAVYGLPDPRIPTCEVTRRVKVDPEILLKHLRNPNFGFEGKIRVLPEEYEKPGLRGFKTVLMDFGFEQNEDRSKVVWVGDNLRKDIGLGKKLGVYSLWAEYGTVIEPEAIKKLRTFSPEANIHKNVALDPGSNETPKPDAVLKTFSDLERYFK